jgi:hypothetical protein
VIYAIFVLDLRFVPWEEKHTRPSAPLPPQSQVATAE